MKPELRYRLVGGDVRTEEVGISADGENSRWLTLRPETERDIYSVRVTTGWPMTQRIALSGGDAMLLEVSPGGATPRCRRVPYSRLEENRLKPARESRGWRAAVLQNQRASERSVQMLVSLEGLDGEGRTLNQPRPRALWLEMAPSSATTAPPAVRWGEVFGYPAPCWGIDAPGWPLADTAPARPRLGVWWSPDVEPPSQVLRQGSDFRILKDVPREVKLSGATATIDTASVEERYVWVTPAMRERRWCLVIRATHPSGEPLMAMPEGLPVLGQEHRFFAAANRYAGLFWFERAASREQLEGLIARKLAGLRLIALGAMKREAEEQRTFSRFDDLETPSPVPGRPRPVFDPR
jgi:hypothetical protein